MKRFYKLLATAFALALVLSPVTSITSRAEGMGFNPNARDDTDYGERPDDYFSRWETGSSDSGSGKSESAPAPKVEDSGSSNSESGGSNYGDGLGFNQNAQDNTDYGEMPSDYWGNAQTKNNPNDVTTSVSGGQKFRSVMNKEHTAYDVYHKGVSVASFKVTDAKGNVVAFDNVTLEQGEDGLWYLNITFAEGVDTKGLTVTLTKGDASYLSKELGVSGLKVNGKVALSTVPAPKGVGARVCQCGYQVDIANKGGLSAEEKADWKAHAAAHLANGESTSYTDVTY